MWDNLVKKIRPGRPRPADADVRRAHKVDAGAAEGGVSMSDHSAAELENIDARAIRAAGSGAVDRGNRRLVCPACGGQMRLERVGELEIDRCPDCGGIFLDRGELAALSGREPSTYVPRQSGGDQKQSREFFVYTPHGMSKSVRDTHA